MSKKTCIQILILVIVASLAMVGVAQQGEAVRRAVQERTEKRLKREKILADISFDRVVGFTLTALEENYQVKERLLPRVHINDYFTVILNTAKRRALEDNKNKIVLPNNTAAPDSTKDK